MDKKDVLITKDIANRCIHVEQVIGRIKTFAMLRMIRYVVVSSSNFMCCNFSRSLMYSQVTQRQVYRLHYIYLFTLEIHCIIRVKHILTHHSSTANSAELTYHYWMLQQ